MIEKRKSVLIIGINGQDGTLLKQHLLDLNYEVTGINKNDIDITQFKEVDFFLNKVQPDEIYFLAAYHHSSEDKVEGEGDLYAKSININAIAVVNFLEVIRTSLPLCRFFYASSSLIFSSSGAGKHTEESSFEPMCSYSLSKVAGTMACNVYRKKFGVFASVGILYNHESHLRKSNFVTKKISSAVAQIYEQGGGELFIGDINAIVDWGFANDYVKAMHAILQLDQPDDFIIATGEEHSIKEYLQIAFNHVGLNYLDYVKVKADNISRQSIKRIGDSSKLRLLTGWKPSVSFKEMVCDLINYEMKSNQLSNK